tara:strand:+ start:1066 stop:1260 length:195 start_codon:yes stop_codon:yes gene_type:complete
MHDLSNIQKASYAIKMAYPDYNSGTICRILEIDTMDLNQVHRVHLGVWKANKKLGLRGGYKIHA